MNCLVLQLTFQVLLLLQCTTVNGLVSHCATLHCFEINWSALHCIEITCFEMYCTVHCNDVLLMFLQNVWLCTVPILQGPVYSIQYTVYSLQYTIYTIHCTLYSIQYIVYSSTPAVHSSLPWLLNSGSSHGSNCLRDAVKILLMSLLCATKKRMHYICCWARTNLENKEHLTGPV